MRKIIFCFFFTLILLPWSQVSAFHDDIYEPRAPVELLEELQDMDNPFSPTLENSKFRLVSKNGLSLNVNHQNKYFNNKKVKSVVKENTLHNADIETNRIKFLYCTKNPKKEGGRFILASLIKRSEIEKRSKMFRFIVIS